ncbi:hypothetical protein PR048_030609 [Dryococelus australis]|uniref:Uncharacterized protein n=1 Tax=Dryococelus australis TaxID=614101 RepID=A0ABQ9GDA1_9NEOP|nr:hypothetical protein PR048_030609 [Dryococelus australis]
MKELSKQEIPEKTRRPVASPGMIPTCEDPESAFDLNEHRATTRMIAAWWPSVSILRSGFRLRSKHSVTLENRLYEEHSPHEETSRQ